MTCVVVDLERMSEDERQLLSLAYPYAYVDRVRVKLLTVGNSVLAVRHDRLYSFPEWAIITLRSEPLEQL